MPKTPTGYTTKGATRNGVVIGGDNRGADHLVVKGGDTRGGDPMVVTGGDTRGADHESVTSGGTRDPGPAVPDSEYLLFTPPYGS